ncbi:MAG: glycosyltransferase family 2 protein [Patescibacteria group bacterium]
MAEKIDLSIIILNYNTLKLLRQCLGSVKKSKTDGLTFETIVVDNASTDGSVEELQNLKLKMKNDNLKLKIILSQTNLGFAGGNNLGLKSANGRYILFLNSDTEITPQALVEMTNFMDKNPKVGASTPKTMLFSGGMDPDCHRGFPTPWASVCYFLGLERLFPKSKIFGQYHKFYLDLDKPHEIDAGFGTFMFVRKKVLDQVGNFDESYFFYGEDLDLFYRIKKAGWKVMFYPEPLVTHHKGASSGLRKESREISQASREIRIRTAKASIKAMEIFYKKFYQDKYPRWLTWLVILGIRVIGFFRLVYHILIYDTFS